MSWLKRWMARRQLKHTDNLRKSRARFKYFMQETDRYIKKSELQLKRILSGMTHEDYLLFGLETGYITNEDYMKVRSNGRKKL